MNENHEFETIEVNGNESVSKLLELRKDFANSRKYPFIIGNAEGFNLVEENASFQLPTSAEILEKSEEVNISDWFAEQKKEFEEDEDFGEEFDSSKIIGIYTQPEMSARELGMDFDLRLLGHKDILKNTPYEKVLLGIAEIKEPWMLPAFVKFGGWNDCPMPEVHCAVMKYWQEKYGAEIISMTSDVIECKVEKPPRSEDEIMNLAMEQYYYCADIVDQGTGTVAALAATLYDSDYWYFWWD